MTTERLAYLLGGCWIFALGSVVGSFANVCIYRIPWQKSVIWPSSHCPNCQTAILARDNVPILGWLWLGGRCRKCDTSISARYPRIEALAGSLFLAVYLSDLVYGGRNRLETEDFLRVFYHLILLSWLLVATFIDFDYLILPDSLTISGMVVGLGLGWLVPEIRPDPGTMTTHFDGFLFGMKGWLAGGGLILAVRTFGSLVFRKEAMGLGDVTLMAMIGSFLGWQIVPPTLFLAALLGLGHAAVKVVGMIRKWLMRRKSSASDREIPFGPYLSMAAVILMLGWPWFWKGYLASYYRQMGEVVWFLLGQGP